MEIIIVLDGSTDKSEEICYNYARQDKRIKIIKQENKGLSAARNIALDNISGKYVMFVDSDDYVTNQFCEIPYRTAEEYKADVVIFGYYKLNRRGKNERVNSNLDTEIIDRATAYTIGGCIVWNKLYLTSLFKDTRFPEGHVYEDVVITHLIIYKANKIIYLKDNLYYYTYNPNSITHLRSPELLSDFFISNYLRYIVLMSYKYPTDLAYSPLFIAAMAYLARTEPSNSYMYNLAKVIIDDNNFIPKKLL